MIVEAFGVLALGWHVFGLDTHQDALHTFTFQMLLYFALFSLVSARERRCFWASVPSTTLVVALVLDALVGTLLSTIGIPSLRPLPWEQTLTVFSAAMLCCLGVNDFVKVALLKRYATTANSDRKAGETRRGA